MGIAILQFRAYTTIKKMIRAVRQGDGDVAYYTGRRGRILECRPSNAFEDNGHQWFLDGKKCTHEEAERFVLERMHHDMEKKNG